VLGSETALRWLWERKFHGTKVSGSESFTSFLFLGAKVCGNKSSLILRGLVELS